MLTTCLQENAFHAYERAAEFAGTCTHTNTKRKVYPQSNIKCLFQQNSFLPPLLLGQGKNITLAFLTKQSCGVVVYMKLPLFSPDLYNDQGCLETQFAV